MSKIKKVYLCSKCGYESAKWLGKCPDCGEWNSFEEDFIDYSINSNKKETAEKASFSSINNINSSEEIRYLSNINEFDRVLGGGIVPGSVILLSGDPGIGKSTLLLQLCGSISNSLKILYVSGEESQRQIKLRANRLNIDSDNLFISSTTDAQMIINLINDIKPQLVIIDSIQTMQLSNIQSIPGSISQIRDCSSLFIGCAKEMEIPFILIGHVNKDGAIAGPKILEHMVDTVLYLEGERNLSFRILRAIKNRFGSTNEIAVFEMQELGLIQIENPSQLLISERPIGVSGNCITALVEGSRPILTEIQALISKTSYNIPRRTTTGIDLNRACMLIAVLEKRCGYFLGNLDVYLNVAGGFRIDETSADLAIILALISNLLDKPLEEDLLAFGEVGLAGEVRGIGRASQRISEAIRMGFKKIIIPNSNFKELSNTNILNNSEIKIIPVRNIRELKDKM